MQNQHNHHLYPTATCLIRVLHDELAALSANDLQNVDVILPTQRLVLMLQAALAKTRKAFVPGRWQTLQDFLKQQLSDRNIVPLPVANPLDVEIFLNSHLKQECIKGTYKTLHVGHEKSILQFFSEMGKQQNSSCIIKEMRTVLDRDIFRSEKKITSLHTKLNELENIWQETCAWFESNSQTPSFLAESVLAQNVLKIWKDGYQHPRPLKIVGMTSLANIYLPIIKTLSRTSDFYLHTLPESVDAKASPLAEIIHAIEGSHLTKIPRSDEPRSTGIIYAATSIPDEIEACMLRAKELIMEGIAPSHIAILITDENRYEPILRQWLAQNSLAANLALSHRLKQTERGRWLASLAECFIQESDPIALTSFALHTFTVKFLAKGVGLSFEQMNARLTAIFCSELNTGNLLQIISRQKDPKTAAALNLLHEQLQKLLSPAKRTLGESMAALLQTCTDFNILDESYLQDEGLAHAFEQYIAEIKLTMETTGSMLGPVSKDTFWRHLLGSLNKDLRSQGQPLQGVQVLSFSEARHVPFEALIILGCVEGQFPNYLGSDGLIDPYLKQQAGLPSWQNFDAMEELTFDLFDNQIPSLDLMYVAKEELNQLPSRFIGRLLRRNSHVLRPKTPMPLTSKNKIASLSSKPRLASEQIAKIMSSISANRLEDLVACPYKFLYQRLKVRNIDLPTKFENIAIGNLMHKVLEIFFQGSTPLRIAPLNPKTAYDHATTLSRLNDITSTVFQGRFADYELQLRWHSWPRFAEFITNISITNPFYFQPELDLRRHDLHHTIADQIVKLEGKIDQVLSFDDSFLVLDYKKKNSPTPASLVKGQTLQTVYYLWVLGLLDKDKYPSTKGAVAYWEILAGSWQSRSKGAEFQINSDELDFGKSTLDNGVLVENMLNLWQWRMQSIKASGEFAADASHCKYCKLASVCRRNDARYQEYFENSKLRQAQMEALKS